MNAGLGLAGWRFLASPRAYPPDRVDSGKASNLTLQFVEYDISYNTNYIMSV